MTTIGFFGDSFCNRETNEHSMSHDYETYIRQVKNYYNADIVNLGFGGSSIWDLYLNQLKPFIEQPPDITVCVWTNAGRLYHRECRSLHHSAVLEGHSKKKEQEFKQRYPSMPNLFDKSVWDAAKEYYLHIYDDEKEIIEHLALLQYIDNNVFANWPADKKLLHLWAFGEYTHSKIDDVDYIKNIKCPHRWKTGVEIRPPLMWVSAQDTQWVNYPMIDERPNHISGQQNNKIVADAIIRAIDSYVPGSLVMIEE